MDQRLDCKSQFVIEVPAIIKKQQTITALPKFNEQKKTKERKSKKKQRKGK